MPNQSGRSLRTGTTNTVGFMIESGTATRSPATTSSCGVVGGVQQVLDRHGLDLVLLPCGPAEDPHAFLRRIVVAALRRRDDHLGHPAPRSPASSSGAHAAALRGPRPQRGADRARLDRPRLRGRGARRGRPARRARATGGSRSRSPTARPTSATSSCDGYRAAMAAHGLPLDPGLVVAVPRPSEGGGVGSPTALLGDRAAADRGRPDQRAAGDRPLPPAERSRAARRPRPRRGRVPRQPAGPLPVAARSAATTLSLAALGLSPRRDAPAADARDGRAAAVSARPAQLWPLSYAPGASNTRDIRSPD